MDIKNVPDNTIIKVDDNVVGVFSKTTEGNLSVILENGSVTTKDIESLKEFELIQTYDNAIELVIGMTTLI